jgi:hypothetical protein
MLIIQCNVDIDTDAHVCSLAKAVFVFSGVIVGGIQRVSNNEIRNRNSHKKRVGRGHVKRDGPSTPHTWLLTWQSSGQC